MDILLKRRVSGFLENKYMKSLVKTILQIVIRIDYIALYLVCRIRYRINDKKILFLSDSRSDMSGNFAFIYEAVKDDFEVKSFLHNTNKGTKLSFCKELATAKYILVDDFYPLIYPIPLRKETELIQVWHA